MFNKKDIVINTLRSTKKPTPRTDVVLTTSHHANGSKAIRFNINKSLGFKIGDYIAIAPMIDKNIIVFYKVKRKQKGVKTFTLQGSGKVLNGCLVVNEELNKAVSENGVDYKNSRVTGLKRLNRNAGFKVIDQNMYYYINIKED